MNMVDISKQRYTTKHYNKNKLISPKHIDELCTILQNSPSSVNAQPWHFIVIGTEQGRQKILPAIPDFNIPRVQDSSHTVIFCARTPIDDTHLQNVLNQEEKDGRYSNEQDKKGSDQGRHYFVNLNSTTPQNQLVWASKQIYIALGNLLFAAAGMGIDSTAIEGFDDRKIDEILDLPAKGLKSVVVATLGYRAADDSNAKRPKSRLPKEQLFTFL